MHILVLAIVIDLIVTADFWQRCLSNSLGGLFNFRLIKTLELSLLIRRISKNIRYELIAFLLQIAHNRGRVSNLQLSSDPPTDSAEHV